MFFSQTFLLEIFFFINMLMMSHTIIIPTLIYRYLRLRLIKQKYDSNETISIDHISSKILAILIIKYDEEFKWIVLYVICSIWIFLRHMTFHHLYCLSIHVRNRYPKWSIETYTTYRLLKYQWFSLLMIS